MFLQRFQIKLLIDIHIHIDASHICTTILRVRETEEEEERNEEPFITDQQIKQ